MQSIFDPNLVLSFLADEKLKKGVVKLLKEASMWQGEATPGVPYRLDEWERVCRGVPRLLYERLNAKRTCHFRLKLVGVPQESPSGDSVKFVFELPNGRCFESALLRRDGGQRTVVCVSCQVGCRMGCTFCATGTMELEESLMACDIVEQVVVLNRYETKARAGQRIQNTCDPRVAVTNVNFMGMGEPMDNFEEVCHAVSLLYHWSGFGIPSWRITVSTVGFESRRINQLTDKGDFPPISLALSIHAPTDELRRQILPSAVNVTINDVLDAGCRWVQHCARRYPNQQQKYKLCIQYILIDQLNDSQEHANQLAALIKKRNTNAIFVNLIPYNQTRTSKNYKRPDQECVTTFKNILKSHGIDTYVRDSAGQDIQAACGQLVLGTRESSGAQAHAAPSEPPSAATVAPLEPSGVATVPPLELSNVQTHAAPLELSGAATARNTIAQTLTQLSPTQQVVGTVTTGELSQAPPTVGPTVQASISSSQPSLDIAKVDPSPPELADALQVGDIGGTNSQTILRDSGAAEACMALPSSEMTTTAEESKEQLLPNTLATQPSPPVQATETDTQTQPQESGAAQVSDTAETEKNVSATWKSRIKGILVFGVVCITVGVFIGLGKDSVDFLPGHSNSGENNHDGGDSSNPKRKR